MPGTHLSEYVVVDADGTTLGSFGNLDDAAALAADGGGKVVVYESTLTGTYDAILPAAGGPPPPPRISSCRVGSDGGTIPAGGRVLAGADDVVWVEEARPAAGPPRRVRVVVSRPWESAFPLPGGLGGWEFLISWPWRDIDGRQRFAFLYGEPDPF